MELKIDLHVHTIYSGDSFITLEDAIRSAEARGLDGIAITDHNTVEACHKLPENSDLIMIPGIEVSSSEAHILGLGVRASIQKLMTAAETVEKIHSLGGMGVIAHPAALLSKGAKEEAIRRASPDAIETVNSSLIRPFSVKKNLRLAQALGLPQTGGSDAHIPQSIGMAYTCIEADGRRLCDVLEALRKGRTRAEGGRDSWKNIATKVGLRIIKRGVRPYISSSI